MGQTFVELEYAKRIAFDCMLDKCESYSVLRDPEGFRVLATANTSTLYRNSRELYRAEF